MEDEMRRIAAFFQALLQWGRGYSHLIASLLIIAAVFTPALAQGSEVVTVTLGFETEGLDLDTGTVTETLVPDELDGTDIHIAYNALWVQSAVVVPGMAEGIELAYAWDVDFDAVTPESVATLTFSPEAIDAPLRPYDTVVVRTDTGAVFKIGNAFASDIDITFDFAPL
jgi:hypothetical protein